MKRSVIVCLTAAMMMSGGVYSSLAGFYNGSFESWDVVGWSVNNDVGTRASDLSLRPAGLVRTMSSWGENFSFTSPLMPVSGQRFLALNTRAAGDFLGDGTYQTYVSQTIDFGSGDILSGWAAFFDGDATSSDSAWVRIFDSQGELVATPWQATSGVIAAALLDPSVPDWSVWQWSAPASGTYLLQLGVSTSGANNDASYGFFDGVSFQSNPVPEPAPMAIALVSGLVWVVCRQRFGGR